MPWSTDPLNSASSLAETGTNLESILGVTPEDAHRLAEHPGRLTLNDVNALCRAMPADVARRMLDTMTGVFSC